VAGGPLPHRLTADAGFPKELLRLLETEVPRKVVFLSFLLVLAFPIPVNLVKCNARQRAQVTPQHSSVPSNAREFRTTRWSEVLLSAESQAPGSKEALADLCRLYWYPLYAYVRRRGYTLEDAQDLTQGFFLSLLNRKAIRQATPLRGKFRSFLLSSLQNYLCDQSDRERTLKRGRDIQFVPFDFQGGEERYQSEPADPLTPERIFDARWAMTVLGEVLRLLRTEYAALGKTSVIETLEPYLDPANSQRLPTYEEAGAKLQLSVGAVKSLIHRLRRRHHTLLRQEVSRTVTSPASVDEELRSLCDAFIAGEGHIAS
jgi:RNA polymerase sigma factor (sigma-70 family)